MRTRTWAFLLLLGGCGTDAAVREIEIGLGTASAIARTAGMGACGINWPDVLCTQVKTGCTTYPCDGDVEIALGADCPLPLGGEASGTVSVTGQWSTANKATLAQVFTQVKATGESEVAVAKTTSISSEVSGNMVTIKYVGSVAATRAGVQDAAAGGSDSWTITIDTLGTPEPADDKFTVEVSKASAGAGLGTTAKVVSMTGVVLDPSCRKNPIAGKAQITEVQTIVPRIINVAFHAACDGRAEVNGASHQLHFFP